MECLTVSTAPEPISQEFVKSCLEDRVTFLMECSVKIFIIQGHCTESQVFSEVSH